MSNINQTLASEYAGLAGNAAKLSAQAGVKSIKCQYEATKEATAKAYKKVKCKVSDATAKAKSKCRKMKDDSKVMMHSVGEKVRSTTARALEKTACAADSLAAKVSNK